MASTNWPDNWALDASDTRNRQGGQGFISKVRRKTDGIVGALKELHPEHSWKHGAPFSDAAGSQRLARSQGKGHSSHTRVECRPVGAKRRRPLCSHAVDRGRNTGSTRQGKVSVTGRCA